MLIIFYFFCLNIHCETMKTSHYLSDYRSRSLNVSPHLTPTPVRSALSRSSNFSPHLTPTPVRSALPSPKIHLSVPSLDDSLSLLADLSRSLRSLRVKSIDQNFDDFTKIDLTGLNEVLHRYQDLLPKEEYPPSSSRLQLYRYSTVTVLP